MIVSTRQAAALDVAARLEPVSVSLEPVSVRGANSCRETVWRGQRPRRHFLRRLHILRDRDWPLPRLTRQTRGKLKTIPRADEHAPDPRNGGHDQGPDQFRGAASVGC